MEVHGPLLCTKTGPNSSKQYTPAAGSLRTWRDIFDAHDGYVADIPESQYDFSWGLEEQKDVHAETIEEATERAEALVKELKRIASTQQTTSAAPPTLVLVTHAIFIACFTEALFGHPFSQYNAAITQFSVTREGQVLCEFANSVKHLVGHEPSIVPDHVGEGLV